MAKSLSPVKGRGRGKAKSVEPKERSKSRGRPRKESRGRSPTPKGARGRKSSVRRSTSKPRGRSQSRKSEPKPRQRSSSRKSAGRRSSTPAPAEEKETTSKPQTKVQRRQVPTREAAKPKAAVSASAPEKASKAREAPRKVDEFVRKFVQRVKHFGYRRTLSAAWWLVSLPLFVFALHLLCTKDKCYLRFDPTIPKALRVYLDPVVIAYGGIVLALQAVLSALPIGKVVSGFGYRRANYHYRSNSFFCLVVTTAVYLVGVFYLHWPNTQILQTHRFKCVCAATVIAFIYSLVLYVKSFRTSAFHLNHGSQCAPGIQNNHVHDFVYGREISPKIGRTFDLGLLVFRTSNAIWAIAVLSAWLQSRGDGPILGVSYNVAAVSFMQLAYVALGSFNEMHLLKSAVIQQGVGFFFVFTALVLEPLTATLPLKYIVDAKTPQLCIWCYPVILGLFFVGLTLIHYSNALKYANARTGGKILRRGPWGLVRHPNYLGEILCALAWTLPCGKVYLPYGHLIFTILLIICRSRMVEKNTNSEYRSYQSQVKARVVPFIY